MVKERCGICGRKSRRTHMRLNRDEIWLCLDIGACGLRFLRAPRRAPAPVTLFYAGRHRRREIVLGDYGGWISGPSL